ncbi:Uncharacterized conserved protein, DUF305 family [Agreia bicolorata]|uniref:Uncharacterized conserved protein, DUF305 family n=1 Tax=Agreia bicolorata TaxID=110935 RepID=A0A1T4YB92_9MICO|nr:DUF305 domain-containing protein [Agreia bicolorata]KJC63166.1 hypothetical protein TZ00_15860 [Agreia bicolorata]SKA99074.1 Uncharacterized conserved protein, DUF305 family [Agreia bicolorata]
MTEKERPREGSRWRLVTAGVIAGALVLTVGLAGGWILAARSADPTSSSVEAGFARDMQTHHDQAVEMALIVRDLTDDPDIRGLAYDIATSQAQQSGQMYAWLNDWGVPQARPGETMEWMSAPTLDGSAGQGHDHGIPATTDATSSTSASAESGVMPGMASEADLERLRNASGSDAEVLFLTLMIAHHKGGVEMADAVLARSTHPLVTTLARAIVFAQSGEIDYMESLLASRAP